jgi:hypothetical protein
MAGGYNESATVRQTDDTPGAWLFPATAAALALAATTLIVRRKRTA